MNPISARFELEERFAPSRPSRSGTRRRVPRKAAQRLSTAGVSSATERRAPSLDTDKDLLATSVREWSQALEKPRDVYREKLKLHSVVSGSVYKVWQKKRRTAEAMPFETESQTLAREKALEEAGRWEKSHLRVSQCQMEWIGYRAECCLGATQPVAVPIGCNYRLCPLCAWHRSDNARKRIRKMFDRLVHPVLITLTVPNLQSIRKHDFTLMRQRVRKLLKQHEAWISGGVYSLETTYNRAQKSWHLHVHILADVTVPLPKKGETVEVFGRKMGAFQLRKQSLEFDWLRLWSPKWGKKPRTDASDMSRAGEQYEFRRWLEGVREHSTRVYNHQLRAYVRRDDLSAVEMMRREQWNRENRRVVDIKPVTNREGAAFEVLKYITKVSEFSDIPEAVEQFMTAVHGARLIQTFGSWYGVDLSGDANETDWSEMKCECGGNVWKRMGVFYRHHVHMDGSGRWWLVDGLDHRSMGTVVKPKIPALQQRQSG